MKNTADFRLGLSYLLLANILLGVSAIYWKLLKDIPPYQLLVWRIICSAVFTYIVLIGQGKLKEVAKILSSRQKLLITVCTAFLMAVTWYVYMWAVIYGYLVETSIGLYTIPLIVVFLGLIFLREKINKFQWLSILLAITGVLLMTVEYGRIPWVAIVIAFVVSFYSLLKKLFPVDTINGLAVEVTIMLPFAVGYIIYTKSSEISVLHQIDTDAFLILLFSGAVTIVPTMFLIKSAKLLPMSVYGIGLYVAPTAILLMAIFLFKETFSSRHFINFGFVWIALLLYTLSRFKKVKQ